MKPGNLLPSQAKSALEPSLEHRLLDEPRRRWEQLWVWVGERANPIVVKEVRQSLKSRQFAICFGLTLLAAIGWTIVAVSMMVPRIYYLPGGAPLLSGYFAILVIPLMLIVPTGAFMSLAVEKQDSTFDLLSISSLSALQIIHGKMASALLQIALYVSALTPCIVLTYLLRGVSLFTILFLLGLTVVYAVCETALALLLSAVARNTITLFFFGLLALGGLFAGVFCWLAVVFDAGPESFSNPPKEIYLVFFAIGTVLLVAISLVLRAAAAAIDFPSENHSTPLRLRMLLLVVLSLFWTLCGIVASQEAVGSIVYMVGLFIVLMVLGALITGEHGILSPRAQRSLPKTFVGRIFLTWLYPGAGLGYVFLVCLFAGCFVTIASLELYYSALLNNFFGRESVTTACYFLLCYLVIYLGANRLLMMVVPRSIPGRMLGSFSLLAVLLLAGHLIPLITAFYLNDYRSFNYQWHQAFNIVWSIERAVDELPLTELLTGFSSQIGMSLLLVTLCAIGVFGLNLILSTRDVLLVRVAVPPNVRADVEGEQPAAAPSPDPFAEDT